MTFSIGDFNALRCALHEMCRRFSAEFIPEDALFKVRLVADELLSNVLQHGGGRATLRAERVGDEIRLFVRGENEYRPPEESAPADVFSERGRGLFLVDSFCEKREYSEADGVCVLIRIE